MCVMSASFHRLVAPLALFAALLSAPAAVGSEHTVEYRVEAIATAGSGDFAPYYMASLRHGVVTQSNNLLLRAGISHTMDSTARWSYAYGADLVGGYSSSAPYLHWNGSEMQSVERHPSRFWVQQLYATVKHRSVFLTAGLQEHTGALVNSRLSSGDLIESGNSRPIPEVRVGFIDFQNIPFTEGWLQIGGVLSYGKMTDNAWLRDHYNFYSSHIAQGQLYTYKRCFFRTMPSQPLSATFGMQTAGVFGGESKWYRSGKLVKEVHHKSGIKEFAKMFFPTDGGLEFYSGSSLGSWDVQFRYRLPSNAQLKAYFQKPFEDGSGIGFLNGWDGIWGLEYDAPQKGALSAAVVEYLDFTNQSGPMHWDPDDNPGTPVKKRAEGADDYYNNSEYNSYAYYGMAIGSPFMVSPIYNTDGFPQFLYNRIRGFHAGVEGQILPSLSYRVLGGYRRSWGSGYIPLAEPLSATSLMGELTWEVASLPGATLKAQLATDRGSLLGNRTGGCITFAYRGALNL